MNAWLRKKLSVAHAHAGMKKAPSPSATPGWLWSAKGDKQENFLLPFSRVVRRQPGNTLVWSPGPFKEGVLLRDKFLTQAAPDSCRKLKRLAAESGTNLNQVIHSATSFQTGLETKRREGRPSESPREGPLQKALPGDTFSVDSWGTSRRDAPKTGGP